MATRSRVWPDSPTHPGALLADELTARDLTPADLATLARAETNTVEDVLKGRAPVNADFAWGLERALEGISARFWMSLQSDYDLAVARLKRSNT